MTDEKRVKYNAVCKHCGNAKHVWLTSLIGAPPVFCTCGSIMTLSSSELAIVKSTPQASNVRSVEVPPAELCLLGDMQGADGKTYKRQDVFEAMLRHAFGGEVGLTGYGKVGVVPYKEG